jgi:3-dehydroquinate dehydratase-2
LAGDRRQARTAHAREPWRHTSVVSPVATGTIVGLGIHGYELAVAAIARKLQA